MICDTMAQQIPATTISRNSVRGQGSKHYGIIKLRDKLSNSEEKSVQTQFHSEEESVQTQFHSEEESVQTQFHITAQPQE
jgi:hypothetical protein